MVTQGGEAPNASQIVRVGAMLMTARTLMTTMEAMLEQLQGELAMLDGPSGAPAAVVPPPAPAAGPAVGPAVGSEARDAAQLEALREENRQLREAMVGRGVIEQAKGILMAEVGCDPDAAFRLLVDRSRKERRKVRELAQDVVASAGARAAERSVARIYPKSDDLVR